MSATGQIPPRFELVVVVASMGGLEAFSRVLSLLPAWFPTPVLLVQHRSNRQSDPLPSLLSKRTTLPVRTARPGDSATRSGVTLVPGGCVMTLDEMLRFRLHEPDGVVGPGDAMLSSAAAQVGPSAVGVVLTGRMGDGAAGVRAVKRHGGRVLVQDPATAQAPGMPSSAIATGCVDFVLPLTRVGPALVALTMAPGGADLLQVPPPPWANLSA